MKELKEVIRGAGVVGSKSALVEFVERMGEVVMGGWDKIRDKDVSGVNRSKMGINSNNSTSNISTRTTNTTSS